MKAAKTLDQCALCKTKVINKYLCMRHWNLLTHDLQKRIFDAYEPGFLKEKISSPALLAALADAMEFIETHKI